VLLCTYAQTAAYIQKLAKSFKVTVAVFDSVPGHVSIEIPECHFTHGFAEKLH
jgi:hypothetical protein